MTDKGCVSCEPEHAVKTVGVCVCTRKGFWGLVSTEKQKARRKGGLWLIWNQYIFQERGLLYFCIHVKVTAKVSLLSPLRICNFYLVNGLHSYSAF